MNQARPLLPSSYHQLQLYAFAQLQSLAVYQPLLLCQVSRPLHIMPHVVYSKKARYQSPRKEQVGTMLAMTLCLSCSQHWRCIDEVE